MQTKILTSNKTFNELSEALNYPQLSYRTDQMSSNAYTVQPIHHSIPPYLSNPVGFDSSQNYKSKTIDHHNFTDNSFLENVISATSQKEKIVKDPSYSIFRKLEKEPFNLQNMNQISRNQMDLKPARTERRNKPSKTVFLSNFPYKQEVCEPTIKSYLRQTVSNANHWQKKHSFVSSSLINQNKEIILEKLKTNLSCRHHRSMIQSQAKSPYSREENEKHHSYYDLQNQNQNYNNKDIDSHDISRTDKNNFKSQNYRQGSLTDRPQISNGHSFIGKEKLMRHTGSSQFFHQLPTIKKPSIFSRVKEISHELNIEDFSLGECRGEGRFGKFFQAIHKKTGMLVGIKKVVKQSVRLMLDQFIQQIKLSLFVDHPNIVKMYGFFHDQTSFYILMEYMEEGSLYKVIKQNKKLDEEEAAIKLKQICEGINYLHENDILHRDIKPENIVITNDVCKICDLGWATYSKDRRSTYCGTLDYLCPQILQGQSYDNFVDIWAVGVLAFQMLVGKAPFYHISRQQTMNNIMNCDFSFPSQISLNAKSFITKILQKSPDQRFTIDCLLQHSFLVDVSLV